MGPAGLPAPRPEHPRRRQHLLLALLGSEGVGRASGAAAFHPPGRVGRFILMVPRCAWRIAYQADGNADTTHDYQFGADRVSQRLA